MSEAPARSQPPAFPRATIRLQLHKGFTFEDAAQLVPYLAALGLSHIYASPFLMARAGSTHGYDIVDHNRFNPEIGDAATFDRFIERLHQHGMGLIVDFVPNHMGVGGGDNPWWLDVLEWGPSSPFATFFDIDWSPAEPSLKGKVLLPFLGDHYGTVLESGDLKLRFDADRGSFAVRYWEHKFPIAVPHYAQLLKQARDRLGRPHDALSRLIHDLGTLRGSRAVRRQAVVHHHADELKSQLAALHAAEPDLQSALAAVVEEMNGRPGDTASFRPLHALLERQHYRVSYWRVATAEINYRRFFDINDLAGLRMEVSELFEVGHQLIFRLIAEGKVQGLRLDHIDGLYEPAAYCRHLQDRAAYLMMQRESGDDAPLPEPGRSLKSRANPLYLIVEKILARHERLRDDWPVDGTTGYEFINLVNGLYVDPAAEPALTELYLRFIKRPSEFDAVAVDAKRQMVQTNLASEFNVLASDLHEIARQSWTTRDFTLIGIQDALLDLVTHFPVYRTYIDDKGPSEADRRDLDWANAQARKLAWPGDTSVYDFIYGVLSTDLRRDRRFGYRKNDIIRTAKKFQQFTGPVMAKAIEDTAFYRYCRLASLNEVGGEPTRFGVTPAAFHKANRERQRRFPLTLIATATHDHKRGEDTRLRIDALTERPAEWEARVLRWQELNQGRRSDLNGQPVPGRNDEYLFYQTLVGVWPLDLAIPADAGADLPGLADLTERLIGYMTKAMREAKRHTSWTRSNATYEAGVESFVRAVLDPSRAAAFLQDVQAFQRRLTAIAATSSLSQTLLKLTVPGVPDLYQGCELWDLSLVDPDNRRPVDYATRRRFLDEAAPGSLAPLLAHWRDGRVKQQLIARALAVRQAAPALFAEGDYHPLEATGAEADRVVAFRRSHEEGLIAVVAPRLVGALMHSSGEGEPPPGADGPEAGDGPELIPLPPAAAWDDTAVALPEPPAGHVYREIMTDAVIHPVRSLPLADLLAEFPVALLRAEPG